MNEKTVNNSSLTTGQQESHEPKQHIDNPPPSPSTGISSVNIGDSQPHSKD